MYDTDRISVVISGTWWVNSGADFDPAHATPVPAGGYVLRHAHTPHYDGVPSDVKEPAVIALFGIARVSLQLVDPSKPAWRRVCAKVCRRVASGRFHIVLRYTRWR